MVTISETVARNEGQGGNNRYMMSVLGGSALRLDGLRFVDAVPNELDRRCRAGAHPTLPNRWEKGPCDPPLLVGGGVADLRISGLEIRSDKPVLLELRDATGVAIERSRFLDGTVFGIVFVARRLGLPLTLNVVSMMGLILGIGLVVDNGIVVLENVVRLRGRGSISNFRAKTFLWWASLRHVCAR